MEPYHPGGVNIMLMDGSVRFISHALDLAIWRGLGSREGKEISNVDF